jgi:hypothetical protein
LDNSSSQPALYVGDYNAHGYGGGSSGWWYYYTQSQSHVFKFSTHYGRTLGWQGTLGGVSSYVYIEGPHGGYEDTPATNGDPCGNYSYYYTNQCAGPNPPVNFNCDPSYGTASNIAVFQSTAQPGAVGDSNNWVDSALKDAVVYIAQPSSASVTPNTPTVGWTNDPTAQIKFTAQDGGIGLWSVSITGDQSGWTGTLNPNFPAHNNWWWCEDVTCNEGPVPFTATVGNLTDGIHTITGRAANSIDANAGNASGQPQGGGSATATVKVDRTPPALNVSGTLYDTRMDPSDPQHLTADEDQYGLHVDSTDTTSGVASVDVTIDHQVPPDGTAHFTPSGCSGDGCPVHADWTLNTAQYQDGPHEVEITATDQAGNSTVSTFQIDVEGEDFNRGEPDISPASSAGTVSGDTTNYCHGTSAACASAQAGNPTLNAVTGELPIDKTATPLFVNTDLNYATAGQGLPARRYGFGDNSPLVSVTHRPNVYGDSAYKALNISRVRLIVPYDLIPAAGSDTASANRLQHVKSWYANTLNTSREPLVSFEHSAVHPTRVPSDSEYQQDTTQFIQMFPAVALYTPWNEPNCACQPTATHPDQVARYYNDLVTECNNTQVSSQGCAVAAGDFLDAGFDRFDFATYKNNLISPPRLWAWHPYADGKHHSTTNTDYFLRASYNSSVTSNVWITEAAGVNHQIIAGQLPNSSTRSQEQQGAADTDYLMGTLATYAASGQPHRITRFYYYGWFEDHKFDTGLIRYPYNPLYQCSYSYCGRIRPEAYNTVQSYTAG